MIQRVIFTLTLLTISQWSKALDRPENIPSRLVEIKAKGWYEEKARIWHTYLLNHSEDRAGWLEYFKASYYAGAPNQLLTEQADNLTTKFPNTYEAHYVKAKLLGWGSSGVEQMKLAIQKNNNSTLLLPEQLLLTEIEGDAKHRKDISQKIFDSKRLYPSLLNYAYNVLMSVGHQGALIVKGESMAIPIWLMQDVMKVRQDVKVLNVDLANNTDYLSQWITRHNLDGGQLVQKEDYKKLILKLPELNTQTDFFYGLTLPKDQLNSIEERLYVVGLASLHRNETFDHYNMLKENIERKFLIDYLTVDFNGEPKSATGRVYETNYILPFLLLKEYYDNNNDAKSAEHWEDMVLDIADKSQIKTRVEMLIAAQKRKDIANSFKPTDINVKELDKNLMKVKGNIYASAYEVTNKQYWFYLDNLRKNGHKELYQKSLVDLDKYDEYTANLLANYHYSPANMTLANNPKFKDKGFLNFPAIDMSYEAAKTYCEWLTYQYNEQEDKKFKKVLFRLPTQKEWTMAALGYKDFTSWNLKENTVSSYTSYKKNKKDLKSYNLAEYNVLYPWWYPNINFRDKIQNQMNCYLANVKTSDEIVCARGPKGDGFTITSLVGAYFPNGMGLYDVVGNVSEMIDQKGKSMGGSWDHLPEESTITSINQYENSAPTVGFRLFMEVIEE